MTSFKKMISVTRLKLIPLCISLILGISLKSEAQLYISTFAGGSFASGTGDGGPATNGHLLSPSGVCTDKFGNIYVADQNDCRIRKIDTAGIITTVAGRGPGGASFYGDGGQADSARICYPEGVAVDTAGNIYIADQNNNAIRVVRGGIIHTLAGNGIAGDTVNGGPATAARLWHPADVAVDKYGNVFFVDQDNHKMKRIDTAGIITTIAGTGVPGYNGDGIAADTALLNFPQGIAVDTFGNVYIADFYNSRVRKVDMTTGLISTIAGTGVGGATAGDGGPATAATIWDAAAVGLDKMGNIYLTDFYNFKIRKIDPLGNISTIAGNDTSGFTGDCGPATNAEMSFAQGVTADDSGNVYIADFANSRVRKVSKFRNCIPTSIDNKKDTNQDVSIYPNPSNGEISITVDETIIGLCGEIYNAYGILVRNFIINDARTQINLNDVPQGIYYLAIVNSQNKFYKKFAIFR